MVVCERDSAWEGERYREREGGSVCEGGKGERVVVVVRGRECVN